MVVTFASVVCGVVVVVCELAGVVRVIVVLGKEGEGVVVILPADVLL